MLCILLIKFDTETRKCSVAFKGDLVTENEGQGDSGRSLLHNASVVMQKLVLFNRHGHACIAAL